MEKNRKFRISIDPQVYLLISAAVLLLPCSWVCGWFTAVWIHELGHYLAVWSCRKKIYIIHIGLGGVLMASDDLSTWESLICSLAGPAAGFLVIPLHRTFPIVAICAFAQSVYNLLPIYPLDGGRVLKILLESIFEPITANRIQRIIECLLLLLIFFTGLYIAIVLHGGIIPLVLACIFLIRHSKIKIPCKARLHKVQ